MTRPDIQPHVRLLSVPGLPDAFLVDHQGRTTAQARHVHGSLVLGRVLSGRRVLETDAGTRVVEAGQAYALPPGLAHACHDRTEVRARCLCLGPRSLALLGLDSDFRRRLAREVLAARELIDQDGDRDCVALARAVGVSPWRLSRAFRQGMGLTVPEYRVHRRLCAAKKLLAQGASPAYAALEAGFFDQSHLNREFRRRVGLTPVQYAGALRPDKKHT